MLRAAEVQRAHKRQMASGATDHEVHSVTKHKQKMPRKPPDKPKPQAASTKSTSSQTVQCMFCGNKHSKDRTKCPAFGSTCEYCGKKNHISTQCFTKKRQQKNKTTHQLEYESDDSVFCINKTGSKSPYIVNLNFHADNQVTEHKAQLDSAAGCSAMSIDDLHKILHTDKVKLNPSYGNVKMYNQAGSKPLGTYTFDVSASSTSPRHAITFEILPKGPWPLISAKTCLKIGWLSPPQLVHSISTTKELTREFILEEYSDVFTGLGCLPGEYHIELDPNVNPVQHSPRRVPVPLKAKMKTKLDELEQNGIIKKVTTPTDWISSTVAVQKGEKLRLCIDPKDLNKAIKRPRYQIPTVDEILPGMAKAKIFSVFDAKDGFFQIKLDEESSYLTMFWTPFGRYRYTRCPFGISSATEEYQRRQKEVLEGLEGLDVIADDIICYGSGDTIDEATADHDANAIALLERARKVNLKLNKTKMRLKLTEVPYMGHLLTDTGVKADPSKVEAILKMPRPEDPKAVPRLMGSINYLSKFLPRLSELSEPLRRLTQKDIEWHWESQQEDAFHSIMKLISTAPVLKYYDVHDEVTVQSDASESGLGSVLLQNGQPVAFASRSLSQAEKGYSQIEKECLAVVFACERFDQYLHGRETVKIETDHKPI